MEFTGVIRRAFEPKEGISQKNGNPWKAQEFLIEEVTGQYPRKMCFEVFGEDKLQRFNILEGLEYTVSFDINANEYNGKWYNRIRAWDARPANYAPQQQQQAPQQEYSQAPAQSQEQPPFAPPTDNGGNNLPF